MLRFIFQYCIVFHRVSTAYPSRIHRRSTADPPRIHRGATADRGKMNQLLLNYLKLNKFNLGLLSFFEVALVLFIVYTVHFVDLWGRP